VRKIIRWRSAEEVEGSQPDRSRSGGDSPQRLYRQVKHKYYMK